MGQLGTDDPAAPAVPDAGKAEFARMGLKPAAAPAGAVAQPAAGEDGPAVTLATVWPAGEIILSPLTPGAPTVVITREGTTVSAADAARARAEALKNGLRLREL